MAETVISAAEFARQNALMNEQMQEHHAAITRNLIDQIHKANSQAGAIKVPGFEIEQARQKILVFHCPRCSNRAALSAPGKHLCRGCGALLEIEKAVEVAK